MPDSEVRTMEIIKTAFSLGKSVYLPRCNYYQKEGRKMNFLDMLKVSSFEKVQNLQPQGKYNLLEPVDGEDAMEQGNLDMIIVPGVAFTKNKQRMGHGAGFYDEFLNYYYHKHNRKPYLIGVALQEQLVENIPTEDHDWSLDSLVVANHDDIY
ncbi:5-formyltetrahydrofolate cyclo-ligase [Spathaspora sp. JA1]|nr:5-formyltetrahydrofolate cyclo-ligase [Spathaspora sp. JA1]